MLSSLLFFILMAFKNILLFNTLNVYLFIFGSAGSLLRHWLFSRCGQRAYSLVAEHELLIAVASSVWSTGSRAPRPQ